MVKIKIKSLQEAVKEASMEQSPEEKIQSLTKAFELFSKETKKLEEAYKQLKDQFEAVNQELSVANHQVREKLIELDTVSYYLNSILSNIAQGLIFIDFNGFVTSFNKAAEKILGATSDVVLFNPFWNNFNDTLFGFSMREALSLRRAPGTTFSTLIQSAENKELEINTSFMLREGEERGSPIDAMEGLILLIRDITDEKRLERIATRNDRLRELGEMAAMVAHEIRNPLGGIKGFASLLQRDLQDKPELQQMATYIVEGTNSLNRLVSTILNYARPIKPQVEWMDLVDLIKELRQHLNADSSIDPRVSVNLEIPHTPLLVPIDVQLIKSALLNLIVNAIQAMPEGGTLTLRLVEKEQHACLEVSDTGVGIPPENLEKLYSPFFTTRVSGNGFGLAEVLKIVQAHSGKIEVTSQVGKGTTFSIQLPLNKR